MGIIKAKNVVHEFFRRDEEGNVESITTALDHVNLDVKAGQFIAILGHNGSGKSTLAKHINALLTPTEGVIWVDGMDVLDEDNTIPIRKTAGMVFQNPDNQIIASVVEEDVGFGPENIGVPTEEIWTRVNQSLDYDFAMDWDKKNHAVEVTFILEAQNSSNVETIDDKGEVSDEDVIFEDYVLFYNPAKSRFDEEDYLVTIPYKPKKGLSREFLAYFAETLNEVATEGLSDLMDFLSDDGPEEFGLVWDKEAFEKGKAQLEEKEFFAYPRY